MRSINKKEIKNIIVPSNVTKHLNQEQLDLFIKDGYKLNIKEHTLIKVKETITSKTREEIKKEIIEMGMSEEELGKFINSVIDDTIYRLFHKLAALENIQQKGSPDQQYIDNKCGVTSKELQRTMMSYLASLQ